MGRAARDRSAPLAAVSSAGAGGAGTRELILTTARGLFAEQGYDATSLRQIADAVGTTKAAIYYHYPAKEHLLLELTRPMLDALSELVTGLRAERAPAPERALAAYLDVILGHLPVFHLLAQDPATQNHPDVGSRVRSLVDAVRHHLAGPDPGTERVVRAACAIGVVHGVVALPDRLARESRDIVLSAALAALADTGD